MGLPPLATILTLVLLPSLLGAASARANGYAWDDSTCSTGGSWTNVECWLGGGYPNGVDDTAVIQLDAPGPVVIPTSSIANVKVNALSFDETVSLVVSPNMFLVMTRSTTGTDPNLLVDGVLTVDSGEFGTSYLQAGTPLDAEATNTLTIVGSGEIRLGSNGNLTTATRAKMVVEGGIEVVSSAPVAQPARIAGDIRIDGGEVRVLGGPLRMGGDIQLENGAFVEVFDQFQTGLSEIRLTGALRGGRLYPGPGVVRMNGGTLADIEIQPGHIEIDGSLAYFNGEVTLSAGTEVKVHPSRTLEIGGDAVSGVPVLRNDGVIRVGDPAGGAGYLRNDGSLVVLEGNGRVVLDNLSSQLTGTGTFRNAPGHTIEGKGTINTTLQNQGLLVVDGGRMILFSSVVGPLGDTVVQGTASQFSYLDIRASFSTRNLRVAQHGGLNVGGGHSVVVYGNYVVETVDEAAIGWNSGTQLSFVGAGASQGFETTSEDLGAVNAGFSGNFTIPRVVLGQTGTLVHLRDLRDNGNRTAGDEAVYANELDVQPGTTLNLNGYCFYTKLNGVPHRVLAGEGALFGGGTIVDDPVTAADSPSRADLDAIRVAPNPFNPRTTIRFQLPEYADGRVTIHDLRGRLVRELARGPWPRGEQELIWDGRDDSGRPLASGVYAVRIEAGGTTRVQRATLLK